MAHKFAVLSKEVLSARINEFLRTLYPFKTSSFVEKDTGISAKTVDKWISHSCCPNSSAFDALLNYYGPEFLCALHPDEPDAWFVEAARKVIEDRLRQKLRDLEAQLADLSAADTDRQPSGQGQGHETRNESEDRR